MDLCISQMKNVLSSKHLSEGASVETIGRAYHATEAFVQVWHFSFKCSYPNHIGVSSNIRDIHGRPCMSYSSFTWE